MFRGRLFFVAFSVLLLVGTLHALAIYLEWYWTLRWIDMPVHFLGGMWLALTALWFFFYSPRPLLSAALRWRVPAVLIAVVAVSISWEVFEVSIGAAGEPGYALNTARDVTSDILGGMVALAVAHWFTDEKRAPHAV